MKCVILQPSYIPWRGYFHQIQKADVFVFYDDVQYDRRGWRNRNLIPTANGPQWLTVPVLNKHSRQERKLIKDIAINWDDAWQHKHASTLAVLYRGAPHFARYAGLIERMYSARYTYLADFTIDTTRWLAAELGITRTRFLRSSTLPACGTKTARLLSILQHLGATHYITGPSAKAYLDEDAFHDAGIAIEYMAYEYPPYPQLHAPFDPHVSIVDLLFMTGPDAAQFIWKC